MALNELRMMELIKSTLGRLFKTKLELFSHTLPSLATSIMQMPATGRLLQHKTVQLSGQTQRSFLLRKTARVVKS